MKQSSYFGSIIFFFLSTMVLIVVFRLTMYILPIIIIVGVIWYLFRLIFGVTNKNKENNETHWGNRNNRTTYTHHTSPDGPIDVEFKVLDEDE